jgi:ubiquinone/menaquinone biosynthesis C-methylase UbiE
MNKIDFSQIATKYEEIVTHSLIHKSSIESLLRLLKIGNNEDVLDLGCGVGNLTRKIKEMTNGRVGQGHSG